MDEQVARVTAVKPVVSRPLTTDAASLDVMEQLGPTVTGRRTNLTTSTGTLSHHSFSNGSKVRLRFHYLNRP